MRGRDPERPDTILHAADAMESRVITVTPETTLAALADVLIRERIGAAPVVEDGHLVGIVSRSDFARVVTLDDALAGLVAAGEWHESFAPGDTAAPSGLPSLVREMNERTVSEAMAPIPYSVAPDTPLEEVARVMTTHHLHRVPVLEGQILRGVISAYDIVRLVAEGRLVAAPYER